MNHLKPLLAGLLLTASGTMFGQGAKNIVISEVLTNNTASIQDEFGRREAWIELENVSFTTYNVRGMFITTDRRVLDKSLSAPDRIKLMRMIPSGEDRTQIGGRHHLLLFANSNPADGKLHLALNVPMSEPVWIALYNGNGVELIDSVTVPALSADHSYARVKGSWSVKAPEAVTPCIENTIEASASKIDQFKERDPYGFAMALMAMGIVFLCLALLWIFFTLFGMVMRHLDTAKKVANAQPIKPITKTVEKTVEMAHKTGNIMQEGLDKKGIDLEVYMAVIGMALKQYEDDVHDVESGVITIKPKDTGWDDEYSQMTHLHDPFLPSDHNAPRIPTTPELH
ncbi:MAG: OadG family protein [Prevotella sp.]|jgi:Na+-transporting methylmalonyl-CoA/oxaloacetate decarboxylase gamma subunit|nr:OadG family protein [Prevotella sp.]